ncbi:MAG: methyltransferase domain-containing protein, partial [Solirubrobacteraceae bacterium]|nr:methyltransferase domain-containing protein [Solirubrobacteraceae bacterium]
RRAMLPYTWHQDRINRELADAIEQANRRSAEALSLLQEQAAMTDARLLQEIRGHQATIDTLIEQLGTEQVARQRSEAEARHGVARLQARAFDLPVPERPWTHEYNALHRGLVTVALDDPGFQRWFREAEELPDGYGVGFDERVVEYPWLLAQDPDGRVLDAGSVLNHDHLLDRFRPRFDALTIATLVTEDETFPERDISYLDADLRELPFADESFDATVCLSTLEHVGMDNAYYGAGEDVAAVAEDPAKEARCALAELLRVTRTGGKVLLSVPFGHAERLGWLRVFGPADLDALLADVPAEHRRVEIFGYTANGWQRTTADAVIDARYRDYQADPSPVDDAAAAARAVACVAVTVF